MVKRWLSTFAEQTSPAALQVVAEDLGERMRCSHDLGRQRGGFLRSGACSSRTGADGDRRQRASVSRHRAVRTNNIDAMCQHCSAAACGSSCRLQALQNEGTHCSPTKPAFCTRFEIGHSHGPWLCPN